MYKVAFVSQFCHNDYDYVYQLYAKLGFVLHLPKKHPLEGE